MCRFLEPPLVTVEMAQSQLLHDTGDAISLTTHHPPSPPCKTVECISMGFISAGKSLRFTVFPVNKLKIARIYIYTTIRYLEKRLVSQNLH
jgi:hypothetical protein